jgi:hypothetical protein
MSAPVNDTPTDELDDATLHAWLSGALEPPQALVVEEILRQTPEIQRRIEQLEQAASPPRPDPWRIPPPGIPGGRMGFGLSTAQAAVFGGALRPGDRFELRIESVVEQAADQLVLVLRRLAGAWQVVFPTDADGTLTAADLPEKDGARVLDVSAGPEAGRQRWAIALAPRDAVDWAAEGAERFAAVITGVAGGDVPVASVEVAVAGS